MGTLVDTSPDAGGGRCPEVRPRRGYGAPVTDAWPDLDRLPGVADAVESARVSVSALRRHPANRQGVRATAAAAAVRAARASAAIDGAPLALDQPGDGGTSAVADPLLAGALRVAAGLPELVPIWRRAPLQALARIHLLVAADGTDPAAVGRPDRSDPEVSARLAGLAEAVVRAPWAGPVKTAVVQAELLALRPFGAVSGVVARAAGRLEMMANGLDPAGLGVPEVAFLRLGDRYAAAVAGYARGDDGALGGWIVLVCASLVTGAREGRSIAEAASGGPR